MSGIFQQVAFSVLFTLAGGYQHPLPASLTGGEDHLAGHLSRSPSNRVEGHQGDASNLQGTRLPQQVSNLPGEESFISLFQDKDTAKPAQPEPVSPRGVLPRNWRKLGLTDAQVKAIYKAQYTFKQKEEALKKQLETLKQEEYNELLKQLTDAQKARLKELNK